MIGIGPSFSTFFLVLFPPFLAIAQYGRPTNVLPLEKSWGEIKVATWNQEWFPDGTMASRCTMPRT